MTMRAGFSGARLLPKPVAPSSEGRDRARGQRRHRNGESDPQRHEQSVIHGQLENSDENGR